MSECDDYGPDDATREAEIKRTEGARAVHLQRLREYPNVVGTGVGLREVGGEVTEQIALRVYVSRKLPVEDLAPEDMLPREIDGIPIDVVLAPMYPLQVPAAHRREHDAPPGGVSIGNLDLGGSGTLGASVCDAQTGEQLVLSNWHVLCGRRTPGPGPGCRRSEPVIQLGQGGGDTGGTDDRFAELHRAVLSREVDAAVARVTLERFVEQTLFGLGALNGLGRPRLGQAVRKSGRTTGLTSAVITDLSAEVEIPYSDVEPGFGVGALNWSMRFRNQIVVHGEGFSRRGDSGSLVVDAANRAIGLLFASDLYRRGTLNPIDAVIRELGISFDRGVTQHDLLASLTVLT